MSAPNMLVTSWPSSHVRQFIGITTCRDPLVLTFWLPPRSSGFVPLSGLWVSLIRMHDCLSVSYVTLAASRPVASSGTAENKNIGPLSLLLSVSAGTALRLDFGRIRPAVKSLFGKCGPESTACGQSSTNLPRNRPTLARFRPNSARLRPNLDRNPPLLEKAVPPSIFAELSTLNNL